MILHNYVFVAGSTNPGFCFSWCFRRFCHVVGYLDFRLLRFCLSTANRNWSWNPIGQGSRFFQRMTKGTPGNEVARVVKVFKAHLDKCFVMLTQHKYFNLPPENEPTQTRTCSLSHSQLPTCKKRWFALTDLEKRYFSFFILALRSR